MIRLFSRIKKYYSKKHEVIPVYPPPPPIYPIAKPKLLRRKFQTSIDELVTLLNIGDKKVLIRHVMEVIELFVEYVQSLPASQYDHHRFSTGLLDHSLNVAIKAVEIINKDELLLQRMSYKFIDMERCEHVESVARITVAIGGLMHDVGKLMTDYVVIDADKKNEKVDYTNYQHIDRWNPLDTSLYKWAKSRGIKSFVLEWNEGRHKKHELMGATIIPVILGANNGWLAEESPYAYQLMLICLSNPSCRNVFSTIIRQADSESTHEWVSFKCVGGSNLHAY